jgi:hypothetical protein
LAFTFPDGLPLHIARCIGTVALERRDVIDHVAGADAGGTSGGRQGMKALKLVSGDRVARVEQRSGRDARPREDMGSSGNAGAAACMYEPSKQSNEKRREQFRVLSLASR